MLLRIALLPLLLLIQTYGIGQNLDPVAWKVNTQKTGSNTYEVKIKAQIDPDWVIYSMISPENGPIATKIVFDQSEDNVTLQNSIIEDLEPVKVYDKLFEQEVIKFSNEASYTQSVISEINNATLTGTITFMACNGKQCLPPTKVPFLTVLN